MQFFNCHTHKYSSKHFLLELVNQYPREFDPNIPFYSIGIHPWYIVQERISEDLAIIESKLSEINCGAIGECGLDKRIEVPLQLQLEVFEKQLALAQKYQKPVIIHCVAAFQELVAVKKRLQITVPLIIHGFSKTEELAKQLIGAGFYLSFGKYLLRNPDLKQAFLSIPSDRFFLETDTVEETIDEVYELAAEYKNITIEELQQQINQNFNTIFAPNKQ